MASASRVALSTLLRQAWLAARALPPALPGLGAREAASALAFRVWGERPLAVPELVNLAAWAWLARDRAVVHSLRPSVPRLVRATDLHQLPDEAPALLRAPWCLEVGRPERGERLWGDTWALAGYEVDGAHYLFGLEGDGARVVPWRPRWSGRDLAEGVETSVLDAGSVDLGVPASVAGDEAHRAWAVEAARTAIVYALLLDAAGAPVRVTDDATADNARPRDPRRKGAPGPWSTSRVTLPPRGSAPSRRRPWAARGMPPTSPARPPSYAPWSGT